MGLTAGVGYGPNACADVPTVCRYLPAVLPGFDLDASLREIGMIGPSVLPGFGSMF